MKRKYIFAIIILFLLIMFCPKTFASTFSNNLFSINVPKEFKIKSKNENGVEYINGDKIIEILPNNWNDGIDGITLKGRLEFITQGGSLYRKKKYVIKKINIKKFGDYIAYTYYDSKDKMYNYEIPTDNYIIHIDFINVDKNNEYEQILNSLKINDTTNNINKNKSIYLLINWSRIIKIFLIIIVIIIFVFVIVKIIKKKRKNN